jgi:hypothetical protein
MDGRKKHRKDDARRMNEAGHAINDAVGRESCTFDWTGE